jgi:diguanylate cyclase (GGDEF)-like protein
MPLSAIWLLIFMIIVGILNAYLIDSMPLPLAKNFLLHCSILGTLFGLTNFAVIILYRKLEKLKSANQSLKSSLITDSLTGLLNRRAFDKDIKKVNGSGDYSLIFLDIDNFRKFNNDFGHDIGDKVLETVGGKIKACVKATGRVYRYGGEEITIILKDCDKTNALSMAEKIRLEISLINNEPYPQITVSLGVSSYPENGPNIHDIIIASDKALLKAKQSGKNCTISS